MATNGVNGQNGLYTLHPEFTTVGFIGCGKLGTAILKGVASKPSHSSPRANGVVDEWHKAKYLVSVRTQLSAHNLRREFTTETDTHFPLRLEAMAMENIEVVRRSHFVILACRASQVEDVLGEPGLAEQLQRRFLLSLVAGVSIPRIRQLLAIAAPPAEDGEAGRRNYSQIMRAVPNLAAAGNHSTTPIADDDLNPTTMLYKTTAEEFLAAVGTVLSVGGGELDAAGVVASPALLAIVAECIVEGAVDGGLGRSNAQALVCCAMMSTYKLMVRRWCPRGLASPAEIQEQTSLDDHGCFFVGGVVDLRADEDVEGLNGIIKDVIVEALYDVRNQATHAERDH